MTEETLKRKAYSLAMKLQKSGLDQEVIFARLEKEGIPYELIEQVLSNLRIEQKKNHEEKRKESLNMYLVISGISLAVCLLSVFIIPDKVAVPSSIGVLAIILGIIGLVNRSK